jgi:class 3 adenylate cyclase/tetratricopeptide (TPR) repeat protein
MARSGATVARDDARPTVTLVTSDLKGSTALGERLDPEALREVLNRYFTVMRAVFESHGGRIEKIIGDAIVAVFGLPEPADDDALRAVEAAAESMRALALLNDELEAGWGVRLVTRTGVASGEVTFGEDLEGQHVLLGQTVEVSGVMEQNAPPLEVLIADSTRALVAASVEVEAIEPVSPKGSDERFEAFRLVSVKERQGHAAHEAAASQAVVARDTRRTVTLVFALAKAHATTGEEPGPGVLRDVMSRYFDAMREALEHHGGTVEKYIGDAVMAVFGLPIRHEDDAIRAVRAASDMQAALGPLNDGFRAEFGVELESHIGVNTGEVIATGDASSAQRLVTGDTVNTAARLEQAAGSGEIVLGELTRRLAGIEAEVESMPPLTLKGKAEPVPAYRLLRLGHRSSTTSATPFVGRVHELERLSSALIDATTGRQARLVNVVGDAGVGKSRLIREFAERAGASATVLRGRCLPYGNGITFWPLNEAIAGVARIESDDSPPVAIAKIRDLVAGLPTNDGADRLAIVDRVAAALNLTTAQFPVAELVWGARRLLETLAGERPLVFIIDDLHAAESTFLDLLDAVVEARAESPIVVLCSARRELLERHPEWSEAHASDTITLTPLSDDEAGTVVGELLGALDASVRERIAAAAEGNPLYLEQIVSMLVETKAIERDGERWVTRAGAGQLAIPPTVQALVAARLDALESEERQVIEPASVIGLSFAEEALGELVEEPLKPLLDDELGSLSTKELIRPVQGSEIVFRFGHGVIRETAYGGLLKRVRAALHERFVVWAERINRERGREQEFEEILGYHLEQAYRYRTELGAIDEAARAVGEQAAAKLSNAGRRSLARGDLPAAVSLLRRSVDLLPPTSSFRVELEVDLADGLLQQGAFDDCQVVLDTARGAADELSDRRLGARVALIQAGLNQFRGGEDVAVRALETVAATTPVLEAAGDDAGLARAARLEMFTEVMQGHFKAATAAAERIVSHARRARDQRLVSRSIVPIAYMLWHGPLPVPEAIGRCRELLGDEVVAGDRKLEAVLHAALGVLLAMNEEFEAARAEYRRNQAIRAELGSGIDTHSTSLESARVEVLAGDLDAAARELRRDDAALAALGEAYLRSTIVAMLGDVLWRLGDPAGADRATSIAEELAGEDDVLSQVIVRSTRARLLAGSGDVADALEAVRSAVAMVEQSEETALHADTLVALADVLEAAGDGDGARDALHDALGIVDAKGDRATARRVRARLDRSGVAAR